ncbi:MAG TPA: hypothetical protein VKD47_05930 [Miltoncostaeaceae bacterium]|nr:hypothetical protein [Miltoncostaeaceae bacterium]
MRIAATPDRRELARRRSGGLEITLYWHADDGSTSIAVHQEATGETLAFPVPSDRALHAFHHPFVHLAEAVGAPAAEAATNGLSAARR